MDELREAFTDVIPPTDGKHTCTLGLVALTSVTVQSGRKLLSYPQ